ncbi:MAG TPA: nuclear transport factor 2 family protein [Parvularculaceae bacterium]|nr:nuclear transport factor 2 family protein [Parvularculaceae bacterium]
MRASFIVLAAALAAGPAMASDADDAMAAVTQFTNGFNSGDIASSLALCADETNIIDEFAPFMWQGDGACAAWANAFDADAAARGVSGGVVTLKKPKHVDIAGDNAYIVTPVSYDFMQNGKKMGEPNATLTVALHKEATGWRITAWAWSKD